MHGAIYIGYSVIERVIISYLDFGYFNDVQAYPILNNAHSILNDAHSILNKAHHNLNHR